MRHIILIALSLFCLLPVALYARDIAVLVEDAELGLPLEGAVVTLRNGRRFVCDEEGLAQVFLDDDLPAALQVSYPGYDTQRLAIPAADADGIERFTVQLRLAGIMVGRELVIEADRPQTSETKTGRSVVIAERELAQTAEIGIVEDVMSSVKLLPGVGYTGMFGALPSIRGGDPGDLMAAFDGFYLERPYHWLGAVSIFDPKMVASARLSHGVFSSRYGHTISGLLEISSKTPSPTETELEVALGTSAASVNVSLPLNGRGGVMFMGKVTYWDTLVWTARGLSRVTDNETLDMINNVSTAPNIRSAALSANYRINPYVEWRLNCFFGSDGVGADVHNEYDEQNTWGEMDVSADYLNYQGFVITGLTASPHQSVALKFTAGAGFMRTITGDTASNNITARYNQDFLDSLAPYPFLLGLITGQTYTAPDVNVQLEVEHTIVNAQGRADIDWDLGGGFIAAAGVQELYTMWAQKQDIAMLMELPVSALTPECLAGLPPQLAALLPFLGMTNPPENLAIILPSGYYSDVLNHGVTTSGYALVEYSSPRRRFGAELGLRVDHFYFTGKDFSAATPPALNPRLNIDVNILRNAGNIDSLDVTAGTGLFSSTNSFISFLDGGFGSSDIQFDRSWTSIAGIKADIFRRFSFNIEGYYKRVFNRAYITADIASSETIRPSFQFDGIGNVWGFDLQLQKLESRYWDGWVSYSFTWAKYYDPSGGGEGVNMSSTDSVGAQWYYPSFHRFHNCNIVLNIKPLQWMHIAVRFGFASGQPRDKVDDVIYSYPVLTVDESGRPQVLQKYGRKSWYDENERSSWSLPLDIKISFFPANRKGRTNTEMYLAAENLLSLVYKPEGNTRFNDYTGEDDTAGSGTSGFDLPIPMISFGFKWRY